MKKIIGVLTMLTMVVLSATSVFAASHMTGGNHRNNVVRNANNYVNNISYDDYYTEEDKQLMIDDSISRIEDRKTDLKDRLDIGIITKAQYDYSISILNDRIKDIEANGIYSLYCHGSMMTGVTNSNRGMGRGGCHGRYY